MSALSKEELYRLVDEHRKYPKGKRIILFGAGKVGRTALAFCEIVLSSPPSLCSPAGMTPGMR